MTTPVRIEKWLCTEIGKKIEEKLSSVSNSLLEQIEMELLPAFAEKFEEYALFYDRYFKSVSEEHFPVSNDRWKVSVKDLASTLAVRKAAVPVIAVPLEEKRPYSCTAICWLSSGIPARR
jgi:hypothetical protein